MKLLFVLLAVHLAPSVYAVNSSSTSSLGPIINLGYASYAGNTTSSAGLEDGPVVFYGNIPYAQPPVDDLRWRAPRMLNEEAQTSEVVDARGWGPPCLQHPAMVGIGSEDCLKVNVWKPKNVYEGDALPVAVYIHGGGFNANSPQGFPLYNWVEQRGKLVGVSITYRLGLLGFLGGSLLATDGDLNVGLLDQRAALEWIQRHISKFGGDPNDITIYGESAGGASMVMQVTAYGGTRPVPFKRVVAQSIGFGPTLTEAEVETAFLHASKTIGCSSSDNVMSCLRGASLGALVSAINSMPMNPSYQFSPVIEGPAGFLPGLPSRLIQSGNFSTVEFIGGHCANDGRTFAGGAPEDFVTDSDIKRLVFSRWPAVSNATMTKALALYPSPQIPGSPFATQYDRAWTMAGEIIFTCMDWYLAESLASRGVENVFSYSWDAPDTVLYNARPYLGAMHTSDLYYLFSGTNTFGNAGNTFTPFNTSEATLSREAIKYWTAFASTGDPSSDQDAHVPLWEKYVRSDALRRMDLSRENDTATGSRMVTVPADEIARLFLSYDESILRYNDMPTMSWTSRRTMSLAAAECFPRLYSLGLALAAFLRHSRSSSQNMTVIKTNRMFVCLEDYTIKNGDHYFRQVMDLLFFLVLIPSVFALENFTSDLGPIVDLGYTTFVGNDTSPSGIQHGPVIFFGGIPYAQPPVGALRWRAPQSMDEYVVNDHEIVDARNWGPPCIQVPAMVGIGSEDCLTLNVWKPRNANNGDALPVAAYIHGGGFSSNSPQGFPLYDWVEQHHGGLIGVSIAYRLGILGFLGGHLVTADGDLNVGLLDQRAALEWIQRHIHNFGGDPSNVTIYGESAGGASVMMQITAYGGTRPLPFKRAVAQSIAFGPTRTDVEVEETFSNVAQLIGCPMHGTNALRCLRKASLGAIVSASNRLPTTEPSQFAPVVEGPAGFMPGLPTRLVASGNFTPVEYIGGYCTGDGRTFTLGQPDDFQTDEDVKNLILYWWPALSNTTLRKALKLYPSPDVPRSPFSTQWDRVSMIARDIDFWCLNWFLAEKLTDSGVDNVYSYAWDAPDTVLYQAQPYLGAMHTSDLYYLFSGTNTFGNAGNTFTPFNTSEAILAEEAIAYWTTFASNGNPSSFTSTTSSLFSSSWERYVTPDDTRQRMVFIRGNDTNTASQMKSISGAEIDRCKFWMREDVIAELRI